MDNPAPLDFKTIHKRAAELVKTDPVFAYAVAKEIRKSVIGKKSEDFKLQIMCQVIGEAWNSLVDLNQHHQHSQGYTETVVAIAADHLIVLFDILMDKFPHDNTNPRSR